MRGFPLYFPFDDLFMDYCCCLIFILGRLSLIFDGEEPSNLGGATLLTPNTLSAFRPSVLISNLASDLVHAHAHF